MCAFDPTDWQDITVFGIDATNNLCWNYPDATFDKSYVYYQLPDNKLWNLFYVGTNSYCPFPAALPSGTSLKVKGKIVRKKRLPYPDIGNDRFDAKFNDLIFSLNPTHPTPPTPPVGFYQNNFFDITGFNLNLASGQLSWDTSNPGNVDMCHLMILPPGSLVWQLLYSGPFATGTLQAAIGQDVLLKGKAYNSAYYIPAYVDPNLHRSFICSMVKP